MFSFLVGGLVGLGIGSIVTSLIILNNQEKAMKVVEAEKAALQAALAAAQKKVQ